MANAITLSANYLANLDEVYKNADLTADLTCDPSLVKAGANAKEVKLPKISMDGLGDYSRNSGYTKGDVTLTYETKQCEYDRGRKFEVDSMDNEESAEVAFGRLGAEFIRTKVVPEKNAYLFAKLAGTNGISKVASGATLDDGNDVMSAIKVAVDKMDNDEVSPEGRILYITPSNLSAIKALDTTKSRELLDGFSKIVKVPQSRFYTAIDMYDGTTSGEEAGGYIKDATTGKDINFMIVQKDAVIKYDKHVASNIITPEENQGSDAWMQKYRNYGIVSVWENKVAGIYLHHKA